jgi:ribosomal protein L11 methyltransferase
LETEPMENHSFDATPRFRVIPPEAPADPRSIVLVPSAAFGDGRHETTRMCLAALAAFAPAGAFRMLDVGSGTGILAIAAAKLGGEAIGVEIDPEANAVAAENARRSGVDRCVAFGTAWPSGTFDLVVANILLATLVALADDLVARLAARGTLVLSGLVSTDVPAIVACFAPRLGGRRPDIFERAEWRTVVWRSPP